MSIRFVKCRECGATFNKTTGARTYVSTIVSVCLLALVAVGVFALMLMG